VESCHQRAAVQQWISPRKRSPDWRRRIFRPVAPAGPTRIRSVMTHRPGRPRWNCPSSRWSRPIPLRHAAMPVTAASGAFAKAARSVSAGEFAKITVARSALFVNQARW